MTKATLILTPADVLFFGDGRKTDTGGVASGSPFPTPAGVAGAVRTWMLDSVGANLGLLPKEKTLAAMEAWAQRECPAAEWVVKATCVGPLPVHNSSTLYPIPLNYARLENQPHLVAALPADCIPGSAQAHDWTLRAAVLPKLLPLVPRPPVPFQLVGGEWLTQAAMLNALNRRPVTDQCKPMAVEERRIGISVDADAGTAADAKLYANSYTRLVKGIAIRVDVWSEDNDLAKRLAEAAKHRAWLKLGGEGRVARVQVRQWMGLPAAPGMGTKFTTVLATPGRFARTGWLPELPGCTLTAAAVGRPVPFSGWNVAGRCPLRSAWAVQAGAVYFWEGTPEGGDPHGTLLSTTDEDRSAGWGLCLRGVWN